MPNAHTDPRAAGFNYGVGWGSAPKPAEYFRLENRARDMRANAQALNARLWAVEMALRNLRLASTPQEKEKAVSDLREMEEHWAEKYWKES